MNDRGPLIGAAAALLLLAGAVAPLLGKRHRAGADASAAVSPPAIVRVSPATRRSLQRGGTHLTGTLRSGSEATLSARIGARVLAVSVRPGERVRRGQELVRLDASDVRRQAEQAEAAAAAARAAFDKAGEGERLKAQDVERRITEAQRGVEGARLQVDRVEAGSRLQQRSGQAEVRRAQAGVEVARSALAQARRGARPEQRRPLQIQLAQAERTAAQAKKSLEEMELLYARGGVPRVELEQAREAYRRAEDGRDQAKSQLALLEAGATPEEIAAASAQLRSAEAALEAARAGAGREELDRADLAAAQSQLRRAEEGLVAARAARAEVALAASDVRAARAAWQQAVAAARLAAQQLDAPRILSPLDGVVTVVTIHPGELAAPGQPLVTVVGAAGLYLEAAASPRQLGGLHAGQRAAVKLDTLAGRVIAGIVRGVDAIPGPDGRSYPVRIDLPGAPAGLQPGGIARAEVVTAAESEALTVPLEALRPGPVVWLVREGRVVEVPVVTGLQDDRSAGVRGALREGEPVVVSAPPGLHAGDPVKARAAPADTAGGGTRG